MKLNKQGLPIFEDCTACQLCIDVCTHNAIHCKLNKNGFFKIHINNDLCINCGACRKVCPSLQSSIAINKEIPSPYWGWSNNDNIRLKSSSGGVFAQLAYDFITKKNGVIVGASLKDGQEVHHIMIDKIEDLKLIQGSKYLQSNTKGIYKKVLEKLRKGIPVLFSGTPCQIAGILSIVKNKPYSSLLYTVEVICHGIPSYQFHLMGLQLNKAIGVKEFRTKQNGWGKLKLSYIKDYCNSNQSNEFEDFFYLAFFNDFYLRPSCYKCKYAKIPRIADLSIADGWGVENTDIEKQEIYKGISIILINNEIGKDLIHLSDISIKEANWEHFINRNPPIFRNSFYIKRLSLSNHINTLKKLLPLRLSVYIFSCKSPKNFYGIIAKIIYIPLLRLKKKADNKGNKVQKLFLKRINNGR